jgi:hypothetical protein
LAWLATEASGIAKFGGGGRRSGRHGIRIVIVDDQDRGLSASLSGKPPVQRDKKRPYRLKAMFARGLGIPQAPRIRDYWLRARHAIPAYDPGWPPRMREKRGKRRLKEE